jgi:hypothetical protein
MNINELHPILKRPYNEISGSGIIKNCDPKHPHIYFVIPPAPPIEKSGVTFSPNLINEAQKILNKLPAYNEMDELDSKEIEFSQQKKSLSYSVAIMEVILNLPWIKR